MPREMKDTGIEWIGEVPKDWDIVKGKYIFKQRNDRGNFIKLEQLSPTQEFGVIPQTLYEELSGMRAVKLNEKADLNNLKTIHKGDFCISLRSFQGGFEYSEYEGVVSPAYQVFYNYAGDCNQYFRYLFKDKSFIDKMNSYTMSLRDGKNISFNDFGGTLIPKPPLEEQKKIADLLDKKCQEIEEIKETIETEIKTLDEYKKSIITEAVTKGLDKGAEMKDSGIEWIGQIPKHWKVHRISKYFYEGKDKNILGKEINLLSLSYGKIIRKDINTLTGLLPESFNTYNIVETGDIIIRPTDLQNDKKSLRTGLVKERGIITSAYIDLKPYKFTLSKYFHYLLHSYDLMKVFYNMGSGVRQGLNYSEFAKLLVMDPPINEQKAIAEYLDHKTGAINEAIEGKRAQLVALDEYKKSLIYEYVTGKKEA